MNMKITKKILAGTLAVMNIFTTVGAIPANSEKLPAASANMKSEKPKNQRTKKIIVAGTVGAAVGAVAGGLLGGFVDLIRAFYNINKEETHVKLSILCRVFEWYADPKIKERVYKDNTYLGKYLQNLFNALDQVGLGSEKNIEENIDYLYHYKGGIFGFRTECFELEDVLKKKCEETAVWFDDSSGDVDVKSCRERLSLGNYNTLSIRVIVRRGCSRKLSNFKELNFSNGVKFSLKAIALYDEKFRPVVCVKEEDGKWYTHFIFNSQTELLKEENMEHRFSILKSHANLIYTRNS